MTKQIGEAPDDRETQTQSLTAVAFRVADLIELLEYLLVIGRGDASSRIPNLYLESFGTAATTDDNDTAIGISNGVRDQIAQNALQQNGI